MRILLALVGLVGIIVGPPWMTVVCMVLLAVRYPAWEVLFLGLLVDFMWQPSGHHLPLFTFLGIALVWGLEPVRRRFLFR